VKTVDDQSTREANPIAPAIIPPPFSLEDLKAILTTVTKDLSNFVTETNRRLDELAKGISQRPNSEVTPPRMIQPRGLSFDLTDAQSNRVNSRFPGSLHPANQDGRPPMSHPMASGHISRPPTLDHDGQIDDIYLKLREIGSQVHKGVSSAPEIERMIEETQKTPFTNRVTHTRIPQVKLWIPIYEGESDPKQYMTSFMITVAKAHFSDEKRDVGCCQLFAKGLVGNALTCFSRFEANSIDNFTQLSTACLKQYRVFIPPGASSSDLWSMNQENGEPLNAYLGWFKEILSKVTITDEAAMTAFRKWLFQGSQLRKYLAIREPLDLDDALHTASRYAFLEEEDAKLAGKSQPPKAKEKAREVYKEPRQHYDPQANKRGMVFGAIDSDDQPQQPGKPKNSKNSYFRFHQFGGHSTEECKHLLNILLGKYKSGEIEAVYYPKNGKNKRKDDFKQAQGKPANVGQYLLEHQPNKEEDHTEEARIPENKPPAPQKDGGDSNPNELQTILVEEFPWLWPDYSTTKIRSQPWRKELGKYVALEPPLKPNH